MNSSQSVAFFHSCYYLIITTIFLLIIQSSGLNEDGLSLLSFKYSVLADPLSALQSWNIWDETPCSWQGVSCSVVPGLLGGAYPRVTGIVLANCQLLGSISSNLTMIQHLQILDLSNNSLAGPVPVSLFNASELQYLDLSNNLIIGELPAIINGLQNLTVLNLSDNALAGKIPNNLTTMVNLTAVSLNNNYFSGVLPSRFDSVQFMDLSSNLMNGTLPPDFGGRSLRHLNISYNRFSGEIPPEFSEAIPENATIDLSFNNFTGAVPETTLFSNQEMKSFSGNHGLCGKALEKPCPSIPVNITPTSYAVSPAIAAVPKTIESNPDNTSTSSKTKSNIRPTTIIAIVIGDLAGIVIIVIVFLYVHNTKKKKDVMIVKDSKLAKDDWSNISSESKGGNKTWSCLGKKSADDDDISDTTESSDSDKEDQGQQNQRLEHDNKGGSLVTVDGEKKLEIETLLKASAFILGATGSSIMYKAVLEDGTALAVRRIGEIGVDRFRDFENQVRVIAKLVHPNLVRIRGFYWGVDERLVIYDFVPNGCLANARYRKTGSSPCHLSWEVRLKIAKGIARGLTYLHDKKQVHGNLKPSNILLGHDMEPKIGDFGLERLLVGESSYKVGGSARNFGSKRSTISRESFPDLATGPSPSPSPSSLSCSSYYHAPESLRTLKPNPKWDVYAFGVLLLELLTGRVNDIEEFGQGTGLVVEDQNRAMKMADVAIRGDLEGKEESFLACFKLGIGCVSPAPQKRPSMKDAVHVLEKIPSSTTH